MSLLSLFFPIFCFAFVPKPSTIIQKTVENSGNGTYLIEQEVQFPAVPEPITLKETWLIENENRMRLVVNGTRDLKDKIHWVFVYDNGTKLASFPEGQVRENLNEDFIERYFHFRKVEHLQATLQQLHVLSASLFNKKSINFKKESDVISDPSVHLARVGGVITYALGLPTDVGAQPLPAFFIEQDQFVIRKFRLPSQVEVSADKYSNFARGLSFPRNRTVRWGDKQVLIQALHVQAKAEKSISLNITPSSSLSVVEFGAAKNLIEEFYKRFR